MDFWTDELKLAQRRVIEVERKIALQRQKKEQDHLLGLDTSQHVRLIAVMQESLTRAKVHVQYIERRIEVHGSEADGRQPSGNGTRWA